MSPFSHFIFYFGAVVLAHVLASIAAFYLERWHSGRGT